MFLCSLGDQYPYIIFLDSVHIKTFNDTTKITTTHAYKNYHHFYSSRDTVNIKFKVEKFIQTHKIKKVHIKVQKDKGLWWSTKAEKTVTNTNQISFNVDAGKGNYRIVVYDETERTGYDKPPLFYPKSTKYSIQVTGL